MGLAGCGVGLTGCTTGVAGTAAPLPPTIEISAQFQNCSRVVQDPIQAFVHYILA